MTAPRMFQALRECGCVVGSTYDDDAKAVRSMATWAAKNGYSTRFSVTGKDALPFYCKEHDPTNDHTLGSTKEASPYCRSGMVECSLGLCDTCPQTTK